MASLLFKQSTRGIRCYLPLDRNLRAPWPFTRKRKGRCTYGPVYKEEWEWPNKNKFPELSPKYHKENPVSLRGTTVAVI